MMATRQDFEAELDALVVSDPRGAVLALVTVLRHTLPVFNDREVLETYKKQMATMVPVPGPNQPITESGWTTLE
tara:strand:- start:1123 stop:1344 length:222 start_codon:yes stop_codon:yes gene_type:complete